MTIRSSRRSYCMDYVEYLVEVIYLSLVSHLDVWWCEATRSLYPYAHVYLLALGALATRVKCEMIEYFYADSLLLASWF